FARPLLLALAVAAAAACTDRPADQPGTDSALARDLALANVVASYPEFNDAPLGEAPQPERAAPEVPPAPVIAPRASAPPPQPRAVSQRATPRPQPRPQPQAPEPARERETAPTPGPARAEAAGFAAGTRLALTTDARVCTVSGRPGDKLTATLRDPVRGTGGALIPAGSLLVLEVASVEPAEPAESGAIVFRVRSLDVNRTAYPSRGSGATRGGLQRAQVPAVNASDRRKVVTGAVAGAILGRVIGGDTRGAVVGAAAGGAAGAVSATRGQQFEGCLPAGSPVTIVLEEGLVITA
ncbi:MAG: hypothetical protein H0X64_15515, partial [Gemmatimonadaceae bacterium]|nr:hypothetical protein [Gemmatimonadaceae bacterium]